MTWQGIPTRTRSMRDFNVTRVHSRRKSRHLHLKTARNVEDGRVPQAYGRIMWRGYYCRSHVVEIFTIGHTTVVPAKSFDFAKKEDFKIISLWENQTFDIECSQSDKAST